MSNYNLDINKIDWALINCKERSIYLLTNYSKTEKQLRDKLKQGKKYTDEVIDKTIEFLKSHNFLNDEDFAKRYIETHKSAYSIRVMKQKLWEKGVKNDIIEKAFLDPENAVDETSVIKRLLLKKCPDYYEKKDTMDRKAIQKLYAFLVRKGFSYGKVSEVLKLG